jgi:hypothetical protein
VGWWGRSRGWRGSELGIDEDEEKMEEERFCVKGVYCSFVSIHS